MIEIFAGIFAVLTLGLIPVGYVLSWKTYKELKRFKFLCDNLSIHLDVDDE